LREKSETIELDITGQRFGKLLAINKIEGNDSHRRWKCLCDCGKEKTIRENCLLSGETLSCGCFKKIQNFAGMKFGRLTVIDLDPFEKGKKRKWACKCDCGNIVHVLASSLKRGNTQSCGCLSIDKNYESATDLVGEKFGRLTVISLIRRRNSRDVSERYWYCKCDCGNYTTVIDRSLKHGQTKSCGCLHKDAITIEWSLASFNKLYKTYKYGANKRGLCFELSREEFKELTQTDCVYCGQHPSHSVQNKGGNGAYIYNGIDRIDNNLGYTLKNCVACCKRCNSMKMELSLNDFVEKISKIYCHFILKEN
jgi:hypothetical protein